MRLLCLGLLLASSAFAQTRPRWQVFLLVGQSNMEGKGRVEHLDELVLAGGSDYAHLQNADGTWTSRDDVYIDYLDRRGPLTVGFGTQLDQIGPELQIGHVLGDAIDEPVLLIKLAWGGRSLAVDFRPPSAGGEVGASYLEVIQRTRACLAELDQRFPSVAADGHDLRGLIWFQGWNDRVNQAHNDEYEQNLVHLIGDLREALGAPQLPIVVGESGQGGLTETHPRALSLVAHQKAACNRPEFQGNVRFVPTRQIWHEEPRFDGAYHWLGNAQNFFELGDALGLGMRSLIQPSTGHAQGVVLVMVDDQGWGDVGYNGHPLLKTPHLDAMASDGVRLDRFYAAAPVCSPTRGSLITGRHPARYGIDGANDGHLPHAELALSEVMREEGFATGFFGKWHLGTLTRDVVESNRGGREKHAPHYSPPWEHGFDVSFSTEAKVPTWDPMLKPGTEELYGTYYWTDAKEQVPVEHLRGDDSRIVMDRALDWISAKAKANEPFFSVIWLHAPHKPVVAGPEYLERYAHVEDKELREYLGCLAAVDDQIGRLRKGLRDLGVAKDTLLSYCSDNGPENRQTPGSAGPFRGRKRDLLEGGVRVPGLIEWPSGLEGGRVFEGPVSTMDLFPTVLEAIGRTDAPDNLDGVSLLPRLAGDPGVWSSAFTSGKLRAYHRNSWKIHSTDGGQTFALYNLELDPGEGVDQSELVPEIKAVLVAALHAWEADVAEDRRDAPEASRQ
ncbi:MAG: sulfatase-like hydrolase/transferase [Planctomycetota bacterium]|nr:sulfatase-like hydrolase/transferase [Planctomycetota bacterium]